MALDKNTLHNLRQEYRSAQLSEEEVENDPILQFGKWFSAAVEAQLYEPNVMTLATADRYGKPSARIVLLKGFDENGFIFYTNYESKKGQELQENPQAALVFFWPELERQVRIEGVVSKIDADTSESYFHSRPSASQIGALASAQSKVLQSRKSLEEKAAELTKKYEDKQVPYPKHWGGYLIEPTYIEFWQGRASRLHDRIVYNLVDGSWIINRLAP